MQRIIDHLQFPIALRQKYFRRCSSEVVVLGAKLGTNAVLRLAGRGWVIARAAGAKSGDLPSSRTMPAIDAYGNCKIPQIRLRDRNGGLAKRYERA